MWETIKQILRKSRTTCIIIEEGKPSFVVTPFDEYESLLDGCPPAEAKDFRPEPASRKTELELLEKINQEIVDWKAAQTDDALDIDFDEDDDELKELKIESIPF